MKKSMRLLSLLMAIAMLLSLSALAAETEIAIPEEGIDVPPVTLSVAEAGLPTSEWGLAWTEFKNYVEAASNGNMTIDLYLSGSLGGYAEELGMLEDGSVDMVCIFPPAMAFDLPAFCGMMLAYNSTQEALEMAHFVAYDNEETAPIHDKQLAAHNAMLLPCVIPTGVECFVSTVHVDSYPELFPLKLGLASEATYAYAGFQSLVVIDTTQWYENLRTGVCETANLSAADVVSTKLYEVCSTLVMGDMYQTMGYYAINQDSWNALTPEQQQILTDASIYTEQWAAAYVDDLAAQCVEKCEEAGMNVIYMTDDDIQSLMTPRYTLGYMDLIEGLGGATGTTDDLAVVIKGYMDFLRDHNDVVFEEMDEFLAQHLGAE